jgi:predicted phosphodiesterase
MSVATLYDVHGNLRALEAVLAEVPDGATIVVGGDVVAGGDEPAETLERLRALGDRVRWVRGNADRELTRGEPGLAPEETIEETRRRLTEEQIAFLHGLPPTVQIGRVLYCHATPRNDVMQFVRTIAGKRVVNSGSVGMPYEDRPGAYWSLELVHRGSE